MNCKFKTLLNSVVMKAVCLSLTMIISSLTMYAAKVDKSVTINVNGTTRSYWLYVPNSVNASKATPLVFSLHGTSGHSTDKSPFKTAVADSKGCIVVYPQGTDIYFPVFGGTFPGWHSTGETSEDIDFFKAIIEEVASQYTIDRERIYCCGFSNGGMMTYTVANVASDIFAAFASISGYPINEFHLHHTSARPVPFLHIHGKSDDFVKYSLVPNIVDDMVARDGANPVPEVTTVTGKYRKSVYDATDGGFPYIYYEIDGMRHNDYTANTEDGNSALTMWNFMSKYTLSSPCDTTLKWRPNLSTEGYDAKSHGWTLGTGSSVIIASFGSDQKTDANQNVYHSLQFENGKYKICLKVNAEDGTNIGVKLQKLSGTKKIILNKTATVKDGEATVFFNVTDGWGEYRFMVTRATSSATATLTDVTIYSSSEEEATSIDAPRDNVKYNNKVYSLSGINTPTSCHGFQIVNGRKILNK